MYYFRENSALKNTQKSLGKLEIFFRNIIYFYKKM